MLNIHPENDMTLNVIVLGTDILSLLKKKKQYVFIDTCIKEFLSADERRTPEHFMDSLTLLYSAGLISRVGHKIKLSV